MDNERNVSLLLPIGDFSPFPGSLVISLSTVCCGGFKACFDPPCTSFEAHSVHRFTLVDQFTLENCSLCMVYMMLRKRGEWGKILVSPRH